MKTTINQYVVDLMKMDADVVRRISILNDERMRLLKACKKDVLDVFASFPDPKTMTNEERARMYMILKRLEDEFDKEKKP